MRLCPTVEGNATPLITHLIGVDVCLARQRGFYHKCHRCMYRGKPADWEPEPGRTARRNGTVEVAGDRLPAKAGPSKQSAPPA